MVAPTAPSRQAPGALTWALTLDLPALTPDERPHHVSALDRPHLAGHEVTVNVGDLAPCPRLIWFLADALHTGVSIRLSGPPSTVCAWWRTLHDLNEPAPPPVRARLLPARARHLRILPAPTPDDS